MQLGKESSHLLLWEQFSNQYECILTPTVTVHATVQWDREERSRKAAYLNFSGNTTQVIQWKMRSPKMVSRGDFLKQNNKFHWPTMLARNNKWVYDICQRDLIHATQEVLLLVSQKKRKRETAWVPKRWDKLKPPDFAERKGLFRFAGSEQTSQMNFA